ncbi:MAG: hypothetical protein IJB86_10835 [Clostridia bacterium]|nr:hypothetical protein [Clostridia bacterium]
MKKKFMRIISVVLCIALLTSGASFGTFAARELSVTAQEESVGDSIMKGLYNTLNVIVEGLVRSICAIYVNPRDWQSIDEYDADEIGFMAGRDTYQTSAAEGNAWKLGYSKKSIIPEDFESGKYNLGRDLLNKYAEGVYDDQCIRVAAIDDNSGEGLVILGAIDSLGVTSTDIRSMRKAVLDYCETEGIEVASINISATHAHSALDTQGVSTEFFKKLAATFWRNLFGITKTMSGLENAESFKQHFINVSADAMKEAIANMEEGKLYFSAIDMSEHFKDKRGLISKEDLPDTACLKFVPASGKASTYIADITCHATSFSASNGLVGSDYIYYVDEYIKNADGGNFIMIPGAVGQVSRDIVVDETGMTEFEAKGSGARTLGKLVGEKIMAADFSTELSPVINVKHRELFITPENSILTLACEIGLVNNKIFYKPGIIREYCMATEMGYLEFGNEIAFAMFPGELYPEVFWDDEITGGANWDGTQWPYDNLSTKVEGVTTYAASLTNDAIGYVLTDNNFAFMGHIIGEGIADEVLSVGKHIGSYLVTEYLALIDSLED